MHARVKHLNSSKSPLNDLKVLNKCSETESKLTPAKFYNKKTTRALQDQKGPETERRARSICSWNSMKSIELKALTRWVVRKLKLQSQKQGFVLKWQPNACWQTRVSAYKTPQHTHHDKARARAYLIMCAVLNSPKLFVHKATGKTLYKL